MAALKSSSSQARADREAIQAWIRELERRFNTGPQEIAQRAGIAPSTLYRWIDPDGKTLPGFNNLRKIAAAWGVELPGERTQSDGFAEGDAQPWQGDNSPEGTNLAREPLRANQSRWIVRSRALELAGVMPGDICTLDQLEEARAGDIVVAQVYNFERGTAETKIRIFEPPYLVTHTMDRAASDRPLYADRERTVIMGPVTRLVRIRPAPQA